MTRVPLSGSLPHRRMLIVGLIALAACTDRTPTATSPTEISLAARAAAGNGPTGKSTGPTVKSTVPDSATVDTTLNVRVLGSGFDQGSGAKWAFKGVVSEKIVTNSTVFVSSTELIANITIARNANIGSHDVIVTTATGKPGMGTELFVITMKMTKLPTLGGIVAEAYAINDAGHVVGSSSDPTGYFHAVRWTNEGGAWVIRKIGPTTIYSSEALAINDDGTAVGNSEGVTNASVWRTDWSKTIIGTQWSNATAINNADVIVGWVAPPVAAVRSPVAWKPSGPDWIRYLLERLPGVTQTTCGRDEALGISDDNVIVGFVYDNACVQTAVMWRPSADGSAWLPAERLSPVGILAKSIAQAIVGSTIVGTAYPCASLSGCKRKAYRWVLGGSAGEIGSLDARANGLNRAGDIVGSYVVKSGRMTGFVWSPVTSTFIFLPAFPGTGDNWAWDINDASPRQAVGGTSLNGSGRIAAIWTIP